MLSNRGYSSPRQAGLQTQPTELNPARTLPEDAVYEPSAGKH